MGSLSVSDRRLRKSKTSERRPLMLKDFLMEDLSSCSSNGFKSLPRRQCCTTVRFLLEIDLKPREVSNGSNTKQVLHRRSRSRAAASITVSALQRASDVVIKVVKQFPFPSVKSPSPSTSNKPRKGLLPRSISRKLLRKSFWWKTERVLDEGDNIRRWRSFRDFLEEHDDHKPSDQNTISSTVVTSRLSTSTSSNRYSGAESEFTSDMSSGSSNGNSESSTANDVVVKVGKDISRKVNKKVDITVGEDSVETATTTTASPFQNAKEGKSGAVEGHSLASWALGIAWGSSGWPNEEKEQFSPVSVLDCPFEDEDEDEATSPFRRGLGRTEGSKQKLKHKKIRRFENLQAQTEPVDLEKRMAIMSELEDDNETVSSRHNDDEEGSEEKARELVQLVFKTITPSNKLAFMKSENLLFDFFRERMMAGVVVVEVMKVAEDWINGKQQEVLIGWEVKEGRYGYVKDMEKGGGWRNLDDEIHQLILELEVELWNSLLDQLLLDGL
ncbi:hypothetical protein FNV43_RR09195 [Rhamnella rubrinervis]|uniref:DUF4378 domain-containing protein n=1 Tax=Rhamnella rubrinervis TaxID=2594499 RepID=A0A8K0H9N7_9ROSA|nr:hypothetical protein FNV43_RR09195 [Rhamnella rubrinervis]